MGSIKHQDALATKCLENAQRVLGDGWKHVSKDLQWGLVCSEILVFLLAQDESIPAENVRGMMKQLTTHARQLLDTGGASRARRLTP